MEIKLVSASKEDQSIVQNLARFYVYELSRYCGFLPHWETPEDGLYECFDLGHYWNEKDRYPYLIRVDGELAGFALINKIGTSSEVDWNLGEFFVVAKFQMHGIGRLVAEKIFHQFPGVWELAQMPQNTRAIEFWEKVVDRYTKGDFESGVKQVLEPFPHPMVILKFSSKVTT
jgi:predicted acetyltransferase